MFEGKSAEEIVWLRFKANDHIDACKCYCCQNRGAPFTSMEWNQWETFEGNCKHCGERAGAHRAGMKNAPVGSCMFQDKHGNLIHIDGEVPILKCWYESDENT